MSTQQNDKINLDPERLIQHLLNRLTTTTREAVEYATLCDHVIAENEQLRDEIRMLRGTQAPVSQREDTPG